jgi:hypothetical protein
LIRLASHPVLGIASSPSADGRALLAQAFGLSRLEPVLRVSVLECIFVDDALGVFSSGSRLLWVFRCKLDVGRAKDNVVTGWRVSWSLAAR